MSPRGAGRPVSVLSPRPRSAELPTAAFWAAALRGSHVQGLVAQCLPPSREDPTLFLVCLLYPPLKWPLWNWGGISGRAWQALCTDLLALGLNTR